MTTPHVDCSSFAPRTAGFALAAARRADAQSTTCQGDDHLGLPMRHVPAAVCPVSRRVLDACSNDSREQAGIALLAPSAACGPGNVVVLSAAALRARATLDFPSALARAHQADVSPERRFAELPADAWWRLTVLLSFATRLPHAQAAALPLALMPPAGVRPINPVQALQWLLTRELSRTRGCARLRVLGESLSDAAARDYYRFAAALLPRLIEARRLGDPLPRRQAIEDAWLQPLVQRSWQRLTSQLDLRRTRALLRLAVRHGIGGITDLATDVTRQRLPIGTAGPAPRRADRGLKPSRAMQLRHHAPRGADAPPRACGEPRDRRHQVAAAAVAA